MKTQFYFLFLINILFSVNIIVVNASVCDGEGFTKVEGSDYCYNENLPYVYTTSSIYNGDYKGNSRISHVYEIVGGKGNSNLYSYKDEYGNKKEYNTLGEYAFCIDPGYNAPTTYKYFRGLNLNNYYDVHFYHVYQKYINVKKAKYDAGELSSGEVAKIMDATNVAVRTFAIFDKVSLTELKNNLLNEVWKDDLYEYMIGNKSELSNKGYYEKNGSINDLSYYKEFFDSVLTETKWWVDPLEITPKEIYDEETKMYTFNFEVKFTNENSQYFDDGSENLINGDVNIGFGDAFFDYSLMINNGDFDLSNAYYYTNDGSIDKNTENPNNTRNIYLQMSKEIYDSIKEQTGDVSVQLKYSTYNAMSSDNVFLNYVNARTKGESSKYQRMIVFSKYVKNGIIDSKGHEEIGNNEEVENNMCSQNGNEFYYGTTRIGIEEYKNKCTCSNINNNNINDRNIKKIYNNICPIIKEETYTSSLSRCDLEDVMGENKVTRTFSNNVNDNNQYCILNCDENIDISNFVGYFSTQAGKYFSFNQYPELVATKNCNVDVKYNLWKDDYLKLLNDEVEALNKYEYDYAINNADKTEEECSCGSDCTINKSLYQYTYKEYYLSGDDILYTEKYGSYGGCRNITKPSTYTDSYNESMLSEKKYILEEHFKNLKACNTYLSTVEDKNNYYKFETELSFYYDQTYSHSTIGLRRNDNKPNNESDDSLFKSVVSSSDETGNYLDYKNDNYSYIYISSTGEIKDYYVGVNVSNDYSINRNVEYVYNFSPSVRKYTDALTGLISGNYMRLNNPIYLGYVYDTDITAIAKNNNKTLYKFSKLGDENKIYDYFRDDLERVCNYEIINPIINTPENPEDRAPSLNISYRIVDPSNVDPNQRLSEDDKGFQNWKDIKGQKVIEEIENEASNSNTYNPDNLEYSFSLNSSTMKAIREYNANCDSRDNCDPINYSNITSQYSRLDCNEEGNECKSNFISTATGNSSVFGKKFANVIDGRDDWKYLYYTDSRGYYIDSFEEGEIKYSDLIDILKLGGEEVLP